MSFASINPATGQTLQTFPALTEEEVDQKLELARRAFREHRSGDLRHRTTLLSEAARILDAEKKTLARTMVEEMGKPIGAAVAEAEKCARACRHYAENAERYLADEPLPKVSDTSDSFLRYLPLGPVLAVMPWNFPFWQVFRFAAPAIAAGNVGLLKHAHNVPRCALAIEDIFRRAGAPDGVFQALLIDSRTVERVIEDPRVRAVTLTGSEGAGASVGSCAGRQIKKTVLELGGSDAFIVLPSANLEAAVKVGVNARILNNGQSCIAAKRFIVHRDIYPEFERRFVEALGKLKMGDPMQEGVDLGPLALKGGVEKLDQQVRESLKRGAKLLLGGEPEAGPGFFYPATALSQIPKDAPAYCEEVFGPVALLFEATNVDHALSLANDSIYGLGSSVWTENDAEMQRFIDGLDAGMTFVNAMVASDPSLPFGGVKHSGYGRELGALGMREFMNIKTVQINRGRTYTRSSSE